MGRYVLYGLSNSLVESNTPTPLGPRLLYVTPTEFGFETADGSRTYVKGSGFVWDEALQQFNPDPNAVGAVAQILHYDSAGRFVDAIRLNAGDDAANVNFLQTLLENELSSDPLRFGTDLDSNLLAGDDVIDARFRANDAIVNDVLHGQTGNDRIFGGTGNDFLSGGSGHDRLHGGAGKDRLVGADFFFNVEPDFLTGIGNDRFNGETGNDVMQGGYGADVLVGGSGIDTAVFAGAFDSLAIVNTVSGFAVISPLDGADRLIGIERIATDDGVWRYSAITDSWIKLSNTPGVALVRPASIYKGTDSDDTIANLDPHKSIVYALGGNDVINLSYTSGEKIAFGGTGDDTIAADVGGNFGAARLYGEAGDDSLSGTGNGDFLSGGAGDDTLDGGWSGNDIIRGGTGSDFITGGAGDDELAGGGDADIFHFEVVQRNVGSLVHEEGWQNDVITDFELGVDHLSIATGIHDPGPDRYGRWLARHGRVAACRVSPYESALILLKGVHGAGIVLSDLLI